MYKHLGDIEVPTKHNMKNLLIKAVLLLKKKEYEKNDEMLIRDLESMESMQPYEDKSTTFKFVRNQVGMEKTQWSEIFNSLRTELQKHPDTWKLLHPSYELSEPLPLQLYKKKYNKSTSLRYCMASVLVGFLRDNADITITWGSENIKQNIILTRNSPFVMAFDGHYPCLLHLAPYQEFTIHSINPSDASFYIVYAWIPTNTENERIFMWKNKAYVNGIITKRIAEDETKIIFEETFSDEPISISKSNIHVLPSLVDEVPHPFVDTKSI